MTPAEFQRLSELFAEAASGQGEERARFLAQACVGDPGLRAQLEAMLAAHDSAQGAAASDAANEPSSGLGSLRIDGLQEALVSELCAQEDFHPPRIADYQIVRKLGAGGMGVVYEAVQSHPNRRVALKIIRPEVASERTRQRFLLEVEVLGWLRHPGIAQIYEAGTAETASGPAPFFAMELIDGQPLLDYARAQALGRRERLELLVKVCAALEHAHQKGVIHRDLKSANVLVDATGQPKLLDFGVARVVEAEIAVSRQRTETGQLVGTLAAMSPEQLEGDPARIDTRSDVWALGVLAFELLTGKLPHDLTDKPFPQAALAILHSDALLLGAVDVELRGDLEAIVAKALERERDLRYPSAGAIGLDLERHLNDEPVSAHPQTTVYQLRKLARKHRILVRGGALALAAILGFAAVAAWQWRVAGTQRDLALDAGQSAIRRAREAREITDFLRRMLESVDPRRDGRDAKILTIVQRAVPLLDESLTAEPLVLAALKDIIGTAYYSLGDLNAAEPLLRAALSTRRELLGANDEGVAESLEHLGILLSRRSEYEPAALALKEALAIHEALPGDRRPARARVLDATGLLAERRGDVPGGRKLVEAALDLRRQALGPIHADVVVSLNHVGRLQNIAGEFEAARATMEEALSTARKLWQRPHPDVAECLLNLANLDRDQDRYQSAEGYFVEAVQLFRDLMGPDHPDLGRTLLSLAELEIYTHKLESAREHGEEALRIARAAFGENNEDVATAYVRLANVEYAAQRPEDSRIATRKAIDIFEHLGNETNPAQAQAYEMLAIGAQWQGAVEEALTYFRRAVSVYEKSIGPEAPQVANCLRSIGTTLLRAGRSREAETELARTLEVARKVSGDTSDMTATCAHDLAQAMDRREQKSDVELAEIDRLFRQSHAIYARLHGEKSAEVATVELMLGMHLLKRRELDEAEHLVRSAVAIHTARLPAGHRDLVLASGFLGCILVERQGDPDEAGRLLTESLPGVEGAFGSHHAGTRRILAALVALCERNGDAEGAARHRQALQDAEASAKPR